jgi:hypothetical protein
MRSGGNVSTMSNNTKPEIKIADEDEDDGDPKTTQTSKCKGATTIPIFLKSKCEVFKNERPLMRMEDTCRRVKCTQYAIGVDSSVLVYC